MVFTTLKDSIKYQSDGILVGRQKKRGEKLGDFPSSRSQLCLNIEKKSYMNLELIIFSFLLVLALASAGNMISKPPGVPEQSPASLY